MVVLVSKIQYKKFEVGEFIEATERGYFETISLIENFPWNKERENIVIDLTNPSITIEGKNSDFLKLAVFFNEKFVLHYFNQKQILYTKSFTNLKDTYDYIEHFYEEANFDITDFKQENTWLQHNLKHFVSQNFNYELSPKSIEKFLLRTSGINFVCSIFFILLFFTKGVNHINLLGVLAILLTMLLAGGGINLLLFLNYYSYAKNKVLIMSKGNDTFYFGNKSSPVKYNKKAIHYFHDHQKSKLQKSDKRLCDS